MRAHNVDFDFKTQPNFEGDFQHDLRDFQIEYREETLSLVLGEVSQIYLRATVVLGVTDDPIADCLHADNFFDLRCFVAMHGFMAAQWRKGRYAALSRNREKALKAGLIVQSYAEWFADFHAWFLTEIADWGRNAPHLIRLACLLMVRGRTTEGYMAEIDLWDALNKRYSVVNTPFTPS